MSLDRLLREVRACRLCEAYLPSGPRPIVQMASSARLLIVGQAPGRKVHQSGIPWDDASGDRLREWLGLGTSIFFDPSRVAIIPMGFCYPGVAVNGGDKPPRPECAPAWHECLVKHLPDLQLTLLIGQYAQRHYLKVSTGYSMTQVVKDFSQCPPAYFPLPHPSWRSTFWMRQNLWFENLVIPKLRQAVERAI